MGCSSVSLWSCTAWLVGPLRVGWRESVKTLFSDAKLHQSYIFTTCDSSTSYKMDIPFNCIAFLPTAQWEVMRAGNVWEKKLNQQPAKGQDGAAVWPYCWPIESPQILTDVKVQAKAVGCLLIGDKVSRKCSVGGVLYFSLVQERERLVAGLPVPSRCCCCIPSGLGLRYIKNVFTLSPALGCSKQIGIHLLMASCIKVMCCAKT